MRRGSWMAGFLSLALSAAAAGQESSDAIIKQARALSDAEKYEESNKVLLDLQKRDPRADTYWRIAENYYNIAERMPKEKKDDKLALYAKTEEWARQGMAKDPSLAENTFWTAVGISQQAVVKGIAKSLSLAEDIEKMYKKTLGLKSVYSSDEDSTISNAHFALCVFYRKVPDYRLMEWIFGARGDLDKSVTECAAAVKMFPTNHEYTKELGMSYICRGNRRDRPEDVGEGKKWLKKVGDIPPLDQLDRIDQRDSRMVLDDPSLACGYSRIQQEEVSQSAIKK